MGSFSKHLLPTTFVRPSVQKHQLGPNIKVSSAYKWKPDLQLALLCGSNQLIGKFWLSTLSYRVVTVCHVKEWRDELSAWQHTRESEKEDLT